jgi:glutathione synthase/RimK-type ligase-like ATP-grasp enzyme
MIVPGLRLDPDEWGPYVVEKPSSGMKGAYVRVRRTGRVRYRTPESLPEDYPDRHAPMIAQRFVYTGEWPASTRVYTVFGETMVCHRQVTRTRGNPLTERWGFSKGGIIVVSNTRDREIELVKDQEAIALAERAHRTAFPDVPTLAFDIVRDIDSGELFVLECHPAGHWIGRDFIRQSETTSNVDFNAQFDAVNKTARVLARETRKRAVAAPPLPGRSKRTGQEKGEPR